MLPIRASVERSASENLVRRFGGEMPTASSPHDGVKGAVFPEFGARTPCGFQKIANAAPHRGVMALLSNQSVDRRMRLERGVGFRQLRTCRRTRPG